MFPNLGRYPNKLKQVARCILESVVQDAVLQSDPEKLLVAVPFVGILLVGIFRLDQIVASPKRARAVKRPARGCDENGHLLLSDPDGRPWGALRKTK